MLKKVSIIIISFFLFAHVFASDIPCYDIGKSNFKLKDFTIGLIIDSTQVMDINQIAETKDVQLTNSLLYITSMDNNYWLMFNIRNSTSETIKRIVGFNEAIMETADLYYKTDTGWHHEQNGLSQAIDKRQIKNGCPVFYISLKAGETKTVYLKINTKLIFSFSVIVEDISEYFQKEQTRVIGHWIYFGAALAILIYNIFLLFSLRDKVYLYYVIYAACIIIYTFNSSGFSLYINSNLNIYYTLFSSLAFMGWAVPMFTRELLKTKELSKWIDKVLIIISVAHLALALLIIINIYSYRWISIIGMPSILFLFFVGVFSIIKKIPVANLYVFGMGAYLIGLFMIAGVTLNILPFNNFTRYGFMVGSIIELIVFSLAIARRIKILQEEKIIFQDKLLASEISMKNELKIKVQERTQELVDIGKELIDKNDELSLQVNEKNNALGTLKKTEMNLRESNVTKNKLFSIISHDLRSPFNSILGFANLLLKNHKQYDEVKIEEYLKVVDNSAKQTYKLLDNLLNWARTQTDGFVFNPKKQSLEKILIELIKLEKNNAEIKNIELSYNLSEDINIYADYNMMEIILRNLISNALKFTHINGEVTIDAKQDTDNVIISVSDTGVGIKQEVLQEIFEISQKKSTVGTEDEKGTGLGLVLCKEFVEKHDGKIWVESEIGKGSKFIFSIPRLIS